jgi:rhodanese-related sulfurtransferase
LLLILILPALGGCRSFRHRHPRPPFQKVTPPIAFEIIRDTPDILILDLRTPQEFLGDTGHVYHARNIPLQALPYRLLEISAWREETLLVYCRAGDRCGDDGMAILKSSGFENAVLIDGGIDGWIRAGFRTVLPEDVVSRSATRPGGPEPESPPP